MAIKKIDYSKVDSGVIERGENIFPFVAFDEKRNWDEIEKETCKQYRYNKRHKLLISQREENKQQKREVKYDK